MAKVEGNRIVSIEKLAEGIYKMTLESAHIAASAKPGQFVNIRCCDGTATLLRRPISICRINRSAGSYDIVFQVKGAGTEHLAVKKPGDIIDVMGPLGKHFDIGSQYERIAVIGGGIGIFPLLFLLDKSNAILKYSLLGFRSKDLAVMKKEFAEVSDVSRVATDDGSEGHRGLITELLEKDIKKTDFDIIYACGPMPMLKKIAEIAEGNGIPCQISLEQRMGCGFGACLVCACRIGRGEDFEYRHVCKDGPVFWSRDVSFEK